MKRVIIICEGETEREFCNTILTPHFARKDIFIQSPLIKKSMGGIVKWSELKKQITLHLTNDSNAFVTSLIDYYGLYRKYNFPSWNMAEKCINKNERMKILENGMFESINEGVRYRFIPYLQLHEFEGLLFNEIDIFHEQIPENELVGIHELTQTFTQFSNPEMINDNKETSPSQSLTNSNTTNGGQMTALKRNLSVRRYGSLQINH